ncbi:MAG: transposase [Tepidisphaeraceae bacterium]
MSLWTEDEAGPYQTAPYPGQSWYEGSQPSRLPHEYVRCGTAKLLTLFEPASGHVRVRGVTSTANTVLHPWIRRQLSAVLKKLPPASAVEDDAANLQQWRRWQQGLQWPLGLHERMPPLRMLLVLDNLAGHRSADLVLWLFDHGIMPLYTPLGGSWLNMAESIQRILKRHALDGQHPGTPTEIIRHLETTAAGWNREPTPFEWGGRRAERRRRERLRRRRLGGSGACVIRPIRRHIPLAEQWQQTCHMTH